MKKLVLALSIFFAFTASAQQGRNGFRNDKVQVQVQQNQRDYGRLKLSPRQEKEIFALSRQRLTEREYDAKMRRILSREQYAQYQRNDSHKDRNVAVNRPFRK